MTVTAINYAKALFESKVSKEKVEEAYKIIKENPNLVGILNSPAVKKEQKIGAMKRIFDKSVWGFLALLINNEKFDILSDIMKCYREFASEEAHSLRAKVFCVFEPDEERKQKIADFIKKKYDVESVSVKYIKDESLIGGFIIMVDDNVYDMSYKNKLKALKERL